MKTIRTTLSILALGLMAFSSASAQKAVAPPPKPTDSGPSLAATMQFLQDKLNDIGKVSFVEFLHNTTTGEDFTETNTYEITNATAYPDQCRIAFHWKVTQNGATESDDVHAGVPLRDVQDVVIEPLAQYQNEVDAAAGAPNIITSSTNPPLSALVVRRPHGVVNFLPFTNPQLADRVAKAMTHAVELCGGGNKDPF
ncbi:MAG: hypothetical protein ABSA39_16575 [Edaphobacter sp.]